MSVSHGETFVLKTLQIEMYSVYWRYLPVLSMFFPDELKGSDIMLEAVLEAEVAHNAKEFFSQITKAKWNKNKDNNIIGILVWRIAWTCIYEWNRVWYSGWPINKVQTDQKWYPRYSLLTSYVTFMQGNEWHRKLHLEILFTFACREEIGERNTNAFFLLVFISYVQKRVLDYWFSMLLLTWAYFVNDESSYTLEERKSSPWWVFFLAKRCTLMLLQSSN